MYPSLGKKEIKKLHNYFCDSRGSPVQWNPTGSSGSTICSLAVYGLPARSLLHLLLISFSPAPLPPSLLMSTIKSLMISCFFFIFMIISMNTHVKIILREYGIQYLQVIDGHETYYCIFKVRFKIVFFKNYLNYMIKL